MKKTFPLQAPGKNDDRVRDKIRHEVNKYVRREQQKAPPEGHVRWDFNCRVGVAAENAESCSYKEVGGMIDTVARTGATSVYLEIVTLPVPRKPAV